MKNYLGIDWGEKRIGLAVANNENNIATPFKTIENISELLKIIKEEEINELVIGLPKKMSGAEADNIKFVKFVEILKEKLLEQKIKINFIDERLSSVQADTLTVKSIKQQGRDSLSAMIILQAYLDKYYDQD
jgi:putative Holliday junction resolvase